MQFWLQNGDFLISKRQIVHGACGLVPKELEGSIVSNEYAVLRCKSGIDARFLSYLAHSIHFQQTCFHSSIGVHIEKMIFNTKKWLKWEFNLPPLPEQQKIADILSTWDMAIENTAKLLANAEAQKRALMQQLLTGKLRLKGFEGREWKAVRLDQYFTSRRERGRDGLPTFSVTLDRGVIRRDELERKTDTNLTPEEHLRVYPGDIAYNMMRMWQGASGLIEHEAIVSPAYVVLAPKKGVDPRFASYLFKLPAMVHRFWAYSYGLTDDRLRLYPRDFGRIPWQLPSLPEQKKIADILSTWDAAIETTGKLLANAEAQKRALMQQLLTGKRRVTV